MEEFRRQEKVKNMLCFLPFVFIGILVVEKNKTERIKKNLLYKEILLGFSIILAILLTIIFKGVGTIIAILFYLSLSGYLAYKAFIGDDYDITFIDNIFFKK